MPAASMVSAGAYHTCAVTGSERAVLGSQPGRPPGDGTQIDRGTPHPDRAELHPVGGSRWISQLRGQRRLSAVLGFRTTRANSASAAGSVRCVGAGARSLSTGLRKRPTGELAATPRLLSGAGWQPRSRPRAAASPPGWRLSPGLPRPRRVSARAPPCHRQHLEDAHPAAVPVRFASFIPCRRPCSPPGLR